MTIDELKALKASGRFHHATYRDIGTIWEGLYIYANSHYGLHAFELEGCFGKDNVELEAAYDVVRSSGVSVGAYGNG